MHQLSLFDSSVEQDNIISEINDYVQHISDDSKESAEITINTRNLVTTVLLKAYIDYLFYHENTDFSKVKEIIQNILHTFNESNIFDIQSVWQELFLYMRELYNQRSRSFKQHILQQIDKNIKPSLESLVIDKKVFQESLQQILNLIDTDSKRLIP